MIERIRVTQENIQHYAAVLTALRMQRDRLAHELRRHPVECVFGDVRVVLTSPLDLDQLMSKLDNEIQQRNNFLLAASSGSRSIRSSEPAI